MPGGGFCLDIIAAVRGRKIDNATVPLEALFSVVSASDSQATGLLSFPLSQAVDDGDEGVVLLKDDPANGTGQPGQVFDAYVPPGGGNVVTVRTVPVSAGVFAPAPSGGQLFVVRGQRVASVPVVLGP